MTGKYQVEFTHRAESDLEEIVLYIPENDNVHDAAAVYYKLKDQVSALENLTDRGRIVPELKGINVMGYKEVIHKPYRIIYTIEGKTVYIIAIFHGRREIDDIIYRRVMSL